MSTVPVPTVRFAPPVVGQAEIDEVVAPGGGMTDDEAWTVVGAPRRAITGRSR